MLGTPSPFRDLGKCDDVSIDFTGDTHFERDFQLQKDTLKRVDLDWDIPSCSGVGVTVYTRSNDTSEDELRAQFNELRKIMKKTSCQIGPDS